ncbi:MAG: hypothetical protein LBD13_00005 [Spirochaetaceae bacterium]|jgi:hypothetical protein|nr:hypothetical protein [Spirochaetaceae bacterium]
MFLLILPAAGALAAIGLFCFRPPVLIVTDAAFASLYGPARITAKRIETSAALLRRVQPVMVDDTAGPDMVAFAVEKAGGSPYCVLFPYRYNEGAGRYAEKFPQTPVFIVGGGQNARVKGTVLVGTDIMTDLYRAGLCAGIIARNSGRDVLFFQGEALPEEQREAFQEGLRERGFEKKPKYLSANQDYSDNENIACVVMNGQAAPFLDRNLETPVILFSWLDPELTAASVKVIFDDSPWALAARIVRMIPGRNGIDRIDSTEETLPVAEVVPSDILFPGRRVLDTNILRDLKKAAHKSSIKNKGRISLSMKLLSSLK